MRSRGCLGRYVNIASPMTSSRTPALALAVGAGLAAAAYFCYRRMRPGLKVRIEADKHALGKAAAQFVAKRVNETIVTD